MNKKELGAVLGKLRTRYGSDLTTALEHKNITELFVAALLSPQCSDPQVNRTTRILFKKLRTIKDYDKVGIRTLQSYLKGLNYYKTKARNLKKAARRIMEVYHGKIPRNMNDLMTLHGVGRKVANVILAEGYNINEGIAIDTHCITVAKRLGIDDSGKPERIERELMDMLDQVDWHDASNLFIELGRDTCKARNKECYRCVLNKVCPSSDVARNG